MNPRAGPRGGIHSVIMYWTKISSSIDCFEIQWASIGYLLYL